MDGSPVDYMGGPLVNSIFLSEVTSNEISQILRSLTNGTAGYDKIIACLLKLVSPFIAEPLMYLCNQSLSEGLFPMELKLVNMIPLYKSDDSIIIDLCLYYALYQRSLKKVMYRLLNSLKHTKSLLILLWFRKSHSTYMALMTLLNRLIASLGNDEHVIGIFRLFNGILNCWSCNIVGVRGNALKWFESYLSNRKQYVTYNGISSVKKTIKCSVPQG